MLEKLTSEDFATCLHQPFHIYYSESDSIETTLVEVSTWGEPPPAGKGRQPFSLLFRGKQQGYLPQRIYRVKNDMLGTLDIFLVPLGPDSEGIRYEAVFT